MDSGTVRDGFRHRMSVPVVGGEERGGRYSTWVIPTITQYIRPADLVPLCAAMTSVLAALTFPSSSTRKDRVSGEGQSQIRFPTVRWVCLVCLICLTCDLPQLPQLLQLLRPWLLQVPLQTPALLQTTSSRTRSSTLSLVCVRS